jgi:hypothetical protein
MRKYIIFAAILIALLFTLDLYAEIIVESIKGEAAYKKGRVWEPLKKGMTLAEGTKISTGVKSTVMLNINGDSLQINQLTMMKIFSNKTTAEKKDTHIGLKYGGLRARIQKVGTLKTSFKITTPVATSSVRGTDESNFYGAKSGHTVEAHEGVIVAETPYGVLNYIEGKFVFHLSPDSPRPENLLSSLKKLFLAKVSDTNVTDDESANNEYWGFNVFGSSDDNNIMTGKNIPQGDQTVSVNIGLEWSE